MVFITKPGLQKPHWSAPWSAMKPTKSAASACKPSRVEQDKMGFPSISTVQRPQLEVSQPLLRRETVALLLEHWKADPEKIIRPACDGHAGSPVLFPSWAFPELLALPEGKGGGAVIQNHPDAVRHITIADPFELADADTPEMLETLRGLCHDQETK